MKYFAILFAFCLVLGSCSPAANTPSNNPAGTLPPVAILGVPNSAGDEPPLVTGEDGPVDAPIPGGAEREATAPIVTYLGKSN